MNTSMSIIGTVSVVTIAATSAYFYNHKGRQYAAGKGESIRSDASFATVYRLIQLSTIGIAICCFVSDATIVFRLYESVPAFYCGIAASLGALIVFVASKTQLGSNYSPCFDSLIPHDVVNEGIYRYVRHPIYTANIVLLASLFVATGSAWLLMNALILATYYARAARHEEAALSQRFPQYCRVIESTGRFFPRVDSLRGLFEMQLGPKTVPTKNAQSIRSE